jgi:hypothetical protein
MLDWERDEPNELAIERLGGPPSKPPISEAEQAERTAAMMLHFAEFTQKLARGMGSSPANRFSLAYSADKGGALRNQFYIGGNFRLDEDEALVIDLVDGGAAYFVVPTGNVWGTTLEIVNRTSSLNKAQSVPNPNGSYTFVLSLRDPGVHNWIDPCGLHDGLLTLRLAEFPGGRPQGELSAQSRVVPFAQLEDELPAGILRVTSEERAEQLARRAAAYRRRLPDA